MASNLSELQQRFSIPNLVNINAGKGGLTRISVTTPLATAEVYLHGAHVTHFQPAGQKPLLWVSAESLFQTDKAIRGGVPICFPWFGPKAGDPSAPAHGFARTREWQIESVTSQPDGSVELTLSLAADAQTLQRWPFDFKAIYLIHIGKKLELALLVHNSGTAAFQIEEALHSYFAVEDVQKVSVTGLEGTTYLDKVDGQKQKPQGNDPIAITAETDRVYLKTQSTCRLNDPAQSRQIIVEKSGSQSTVVWNPWIAKSKAMADFGDDEWKQMLCIETCNLGDDRITIQPGASHEMSALISIE